MAPLNSGKMASPEKRKELPMVYEYFRNSSENVQGLVAENEIFMYVYSKSCYYFLIVTI